MWLTLLRNHAQAIVACDFLASSRAALHALSDFGQIYRFAPGGLTKRAMRYNEGYFYGTTVLSVNGFTEKLLFPAPAPENDYSFVNSSIPDSNGRQGGR